MFIKLYSDLHLEFAGFEIPASKTVPDNEIVLVLAGDIYVQKKYKQAIPFLDSIKGRYKSVLLVPGNHEYYGSSIDTADTKMETFLSEYGVTFLNRKSIFIDGVKFIGATLWTDFNRNDPLATFYAQSKMNDYHKIRQGPRGEPYKMKLNPHRTMLINSIDRDYIATELASAGDTPCVVITHHPPTMQYTQIGDRMSDVGYAYGNTGLENLILDHSPKLWLCGHTHIKADYMAGDTRVLNNPRGYAGYERIETDMDSVIEL